MDILNHSSHLNNKGYSTSEDNLTEPRHRWYYFKEGFSTNLVDYAISESGLKSDDIILDPFGGSGTVNLCASQKGIDSIGIEVNPFAFFLSKVKHLNPSLRYLEGKIKKDISIITKGIIKGKKSPFLNFSTFSELTGKEKWLFNSDVLNSFEGGYNELKKINPAYRNLFKLALINSAMANCNAKKDGKCLRYRTNWEKLDFDSEDILKSFEKNIEVIIEDLIKDAIIVQPKIYNADSRNFLNENKLQFKLCITSPPYLNSFDYTDVYRPELFLGRFIKTQESLYDLRKQTLCSHINVLKKLCNFKSDSLLYNKVLAQLNDHRKEFWNGNIPLMVQLYFQQMNNILKRLFILGKKGTQTWMVVANSAYFNFEIPTDLILADLGTKVGWKLKEIHVLREVFKRGSKYSPDVHSLRESAVVFYKP